MAIVPQYVGRTEFVERLAGVARTADTAFLEVVLTDDDDRIVERFRQRRALFSSNGVQHPESDLADDEVDAEVRSANERLVSRAQAHGLPLIYAGAGVEASYAALRAISDQAE